MSAQLKLTGWVENLNGGKQSGATVTVTNEANNEVIGTTTSGTDGTFSVTFPFATSIFSEAKYNGEVIGIQDPQITDVI